jgi:hypothetical protein
MPRDRLSDLVRGATTGSGPQLRAEADGEPGSGVEIEFEGESEVEGEALLRSRLNSATFLCCSS